MAVRVLGYKTVVESKGTWPTNYIAKAQELKVLKDVTYGTYADGAVRGNVALIIWNMLRTPMWDVTSESEKDGLTYGKDNNKTMIDKYFEDYTYATVKFGSFSIDDGKVEVTLAELNDDDAKLKKAKYEYAGNDFYTFVAGQEVEVLVNEKDETLLTMVSTDSDTLKEGAKDSIDKNYDELKGMAYDYAYTRIVKKVVKGASILSTKSIYADDVVKENKYVEINDERYGIDGNEYKNTTFASTTKTDFDSEIIIKDGERVSISDIKEGDVLTQVTVVTLNNNQTPEKFYVIGSTKVEGDLTRCAEVEYENSSKTFVQATIGKQKYAMDGNATYVEDPDAKKLKVVEFGNYKDSIIEKMEGETVTAILDVVTGKVVRIEFDGKIDSGNDENTTVKFFGIADSVDKDGKTYTIDLINEDGKETLEFAKNSTAESTAKSAYANGNDLTGAFIWVELNDEDKISNFGYVAQYGDENAKDFTTTDITYGEKATEKYEVLKLENASYDADTDYVEAKDKSSKIRANDNTVLVKVIYDDKGTQKTTDDEYRVEFETGLKAIKADVKSQTVCAISDKDSSFKRALYLVMFDTASSKSDNQVAKVVTPKADDTYIGGAIIDLEENDGTESSYTIANGTRDLSHYELVVYTITTNAKGKETFNYVAGLKDSELTDDNANHAYVGECDDTGRRFLKDNDKSQEFDLDSKELKDRLEDYMVVEVTVRESDKSTEDAKDYEVSSYKVVSYENINLSEGDRISIDKYDADDASVKGAEVIFVIRGLAKKAN